MVLAQNRPADQRNRIEGPEINPRAYGQLLCDKEGKNMQWRKKTSSLNGPRETGQLHVKE